MNRSSPFNVNYYIRLMASFAGHLGYAGTRKVNHPGFYWSKRWWLAMASAEPYGTHLHLAQDT